MNDNQPTITPTFSKTHQHFYPPLHLQHDKLFRDKASSSKYSAYTTSKKKLSQIHCDLHELEVKFNHFHQNLNLFMNCENRNSLQQSTPKHRKSAEVQMRLNQSASEQLLNLSSLQNGVIFQRSKAEEHSFILEQQPQPFVLSTFDKSRIITLPKSQQVPSIKKVSLQQKQLLQQQNELKQLPSSQLKQKSISNPQKLKKSKINKTHAIRNFPMEYFTNVELLFEIMNRKKHRIKHMSEGKTKKNKQRKTLNQKENLQNKPDRQLMLSEENQCQIQAAVDQSKPVSIPFREENNFSVFQTDRKLSKDTVVRKSSTSKILAIKNKLQSSQKSFIPVQKNFLHRNPTAHQKEPQAKTQRDFNKKNLQTHDLNSPKKFRSRRMLSPKQQIPTNTYVLSGNNFDESTPQSKMNFWSPQNRQLGCFSMKKKNHQFVERNQQTKTANVGSRHKNVLKKQKSDDSLVLMAPTLRNTEFEHVNQTDRQKAGQKEIKTSDLDQTGIFSGEPFYFITKAKKNQKNSPAKLSQYKEEDSFLKKIIQNPKRKSRYCQCCFEGKRENSNQNQSQSKSQSKKHQSSCKAKIQKRSIEKMDTQQVINEQKSIEKMDTQPVIDEQKFSTYQRSRDNIGKIVDKSIEKSKSVTQRNFKDQNQQKDPKQQKLFNKAVSFKINQLPKTKSSSNLLGIKSPQQQVPKQQKSVKNETKSILKSKTEKTKSKKNPTKQTDHSSIQDINIQDQQDSQEIQQQKSKNSQKVDDEENLLRKDQQEIGNSDQLIDQQQQEKLMKNQEPIKGTEQEKSSVLNSFEFIDEQNQAVSGEKMQYVIEYQEKNKRLECGQQKGETHEISSNLSKKEILATQRELEKKYSSNQEEKTQNEAINDSGRSRLIKDQLNRVSRGDQLTVTCQKEDVTIPKVNQQEHQQYKRNKSQQISQQELIRQEDAKDNNEKDQQDVLFVKDQNYSVVDREINSQIEKSDKFYSEIAKKVKEEIQIREFQLFVDQQEKQLNENQNSKNSGFKLTGEQLKQLTSCLNDSGSSLKQQNQKQQITVDLSGLSLAESYLTQLYQKIDLLQHDIPPSNSYPSLLKSSLKSQIIQKPYNHPQAKPQLHHLANQKLSSSQYINPSICVPSQNNNLNHQKEKHQDQQSSMYVLKDEQTVRFDDQCYQDHIIGKSSQGNKGQKLNDEADNFLQEIIQLEDMTKTRKWFEPQSPQQVPVAVLEAEVVEEPISTKAYKQQKQEYEAKQIASQSPNSTKIKQNKALETDNSVQEKKDYNLENQNINNVKSCRNSVEIQSYDKQDEENINIKYTTSHNQVSAKNIAIDSQLPVNQKQKGKCTSIQKLTIKPQNAYLTPIDHNQPNKDHISQPTTNNLAKQSTPHKTNPRPSHTASHLQTFKPSLKVLEHFHSELLSPQSSNNNLTPSYQQSLIQIAISNNSLEEVCSYMTKPFVGGDDVDRVDEGQSFQVGEGGMVGNEFEQRVENDRSEKMKNEDVKRSAEIEEKPPTNNQVLNQAVQVTYPVDGKSVDIKKEQNQNQKIQHQVDDYISQLNSKIIKDSTLHPDQLFSQQDYQISSQINPHQPSQQICENNQPKHIAMIGSLKNHQYKDISSQPVNKLQADCQVPIKDNQANPQYIYHEQALVFTNPQQSNKNEITQEQQKVDSKKARATVDSKVVSICVMEPISEKQPILASGVCQNRLLTVNQVLFHQLNPSRQLNSLHGNTQQQVGPEIHPTLIIQQSLNNFPASCHNQKSQDLISQPEFQLKSTNPLPSLNQNEKCMLSTHQAFTQVQNQNQPHSQTFKQKFYKSSHDNSQTSWNQKFVNSKNQIPTSYYKTQSSLIYSKDTAGAKKRSLQEEKQINECHHIKTQTIEQPVKEVTTNKSSQQKSHKSYNSKIQPSQQPCSHNHLNSTHCNNHQSHHKLQCHQCTRIQNQQQQFHRTHSFINPVMNPFMNPFMNPYATSMDFYNSFQKTKSKNNCYRAGQSQEEEELSNGQDQNYYQDRKRKKNKSSRKVSGKQRSNKANQKRSKRKKQVSQSDQYQSDNLSSEDQHLNAVQQKSKPKNKAPNKAKSRAQESSILNHSQLSDSQQNQSPQLKRHKSPQQKLLRKAQIVNYITNQQTKPILSIKLKTQPAKGKFDKQLKSAMKLLNFIDPQNNFLKRLIEVKADTLKLWLFPNQLQFKHQSSFQSIQIKLPQPLTPTLKPAQISTYISTAAHKLLQQFPYQQSNMVKQLLQMITGSTLFNIKSSSFNKLKNLNKHQNIKGFTFSQQKLDLYQIVASQEIQDIKTKLTEKIVVLKKCTSIKRYHVQDNLQLMNEKVSKGEEVLNVKWEDFLKKFTHSMIGVFGFQYQVRALHFVNQQQKFLTQKSERSTKKNFVFSMQLKASSSAIQNSNKKQQKHNQKQHCLINVNLFGSTAPQTSHNIQPSPTSKGRILVYHQTLPFSNQYKYIGSGDLTFISMRVKEGKYLVVLEFGRKTLENMQEGKVIVNYGGRAVSLGEEKWTNDYASVMAGGETEFFKANKL